MAQINRVIDFVLRHIHQPLVMRALDWLFGTWLPASGHVPSEQPCFEAWIGRPFAHGIARFELRLQLPVERG